VGVQEGVREEDVGIRGKIEIAFRIGPDEALGQKGLCREALEWHSQVALGRPPLLR
jgi:hypothetical protein